MQSSDQNYRSFSAKRCTPLVFDGIPGFPNEIPDGIRKYLPIFDRNQSKSAKKHVQVFSDLMYDYDLCHEDLWMRLFVQTLKGDERDWFSCLPVASISSWEEFSLSFIQQFDGWIDVNLMLDRLMKIQIDQDELIPTFNGRFYKTLMEIPEKYRPEDKVCLIVYLGAFDKKMSYRLRDKEP